MFGKSPQKISITKWNEAPHFPTWAHPSAYYNGSDLLLCFEAAEEDSYTVVMFSGVIEFIVQPFTDESLGHHPLYKYGLKKYEFNIINFSPKTEKWTSLKAMHYVITFKDETHDLVARDCKVILESVLAKSKYEAILAASLSQGFEKT